MVVNPVAGDGKGLADSTRLERFLQQKQVAYTKFIDPWPPHFEGFTDIWLVGGDGTLNYFINKYTTLHLPISIFDGGSGNDFFRAVHGSRSENEVMEIGLTGEIREVDAARCNDKLLLNSFGVGFDGSVARLSMNRKKWKGVNSYFYFIIRQLFSYSSKIYSMQVDGEVRREGIFMINLMNGEYTGGGYKVAPGAEVADGRFQLLTVKPLGILKRLRFLTTVKKGKHLAIRSLVHYQQAKTVTIDSDHLMEAHADGEFMTAYQFRFQVLPGYLRMRY